MTTTRFEFTKRVRPILEVGIGSSVTDQAAALWDVALWDDFDARWNGDEPLWRDVSCDIIDAHTEQGRGRMSDSFPVGTAEITVDNDSGWANPDINFEQDSTIGYLSFSGNADNYITVDDYAALAITGDICVVARFGVQSWPPPYIFGVIAIKFDAWLLDLFGDGTLGFLTIDGGIGQWHYSPAITPATVDRWYAVTVDANDGAGGHVVRWWYGGIDDETPDWVLFDEQTYAGVLTLDTSALDLQFGFQGDGGLVSTLSYLAIYNGTGASGTVGGTKVFEFNGWDLRDSDVPPATFSTSDWFLEDPPGSGLYEYVGPAEYMVETPAGSGLYVWMGSVAVFIETPPGSGLYALVATPAPTFEIMPRVGPNPMVVHYTEGNVPVTAAVRPDTEHLKLRPGRPIRVGVAHRTLGNCWLWYGFIDSIEPRDSAEDWSTVRLRCIDALGEAGRAKISAITESGSGDTARGRFTRILNAIEWPSTKRVVSTAAIRPLYQARMDGQVVDLLRQTADSEGGWAYGDNDGNVVLQDRDWPYHVNDGSVDGTIGNFASDDVCPTEWVRAFSRQDMTTRVIFGRELPEDIEEQMPVVLDDFDGKVLYGIEPFERTDLWTLNDVDLVTNAGRVLASRTASTSMPRVASVTIDVGAGTDTTNHDAAADLLSTLSVHTPSRYRGRLKVGRKVRFADRFFAVGVMHDLSADAWTANISLDRTEPYGALDPVDYVWDTARWDRSLWN